MEQVSSRLRRWVEPREEEAAIITLFNSSLLRTKTKTEKVKLLFSTLPLFSFSLQPLFFSIRLLPVVLISSPILFFFWSTSLFCSPSSPLSVSLSASAPSLCLGPGPSC